MTDIKPEAPTEIPRLRHNRNYRRLWLGQAVSVLGDEVLDTAIMLWLGLVAADGKSWGPAAAAGVVIAKTQPVLLLGPIGGVYADRWDRRRTMLIMDAIRAGLVCGLAVFLVAGASLPVGAQLAVIYLVITLSAIAALFFNPARYGLLTTTVADADRERMGSIIAGTNALAGIVGPALAAMMLVLADVQWSLLVTAAGFMVSFGAVAGIRGAPAPTTRAGTAEGQPPRVRRELLTGLKFVAGNQTLRVMLITAVTVEAGVTAILTLDIFFVTRNLHAPPQVYGWLGTAFGIGSLVGATLAAAFAPRLRATKIYAGGFMLMGVFLIGYSRMTTPLGAIIVLLLAGIPMAAVNSMVGPMVMRSTPEGLIGRVSAVFQPATQLASLLSVGLSAWLAGSVLHDLDATVAGVHFGPIDTIFLAAGAIIALIGTWAGRALRGSEVDKRQRHT